MLRSVKENLLDGTSPDPAEPDHAQGLSRLRLARLLTVGGLFLVVSWAGLWQALPAVARATGLALFAVLGLAALIPLAKFRWPGRDAALSRLDRGSGIRHRPATALTDTLAS